MGDPQVDYGRQIEPGNEPDDDEIGRADRQARPGTDVGRGQSHASQCVERDRRVAGDEIGLHGAPPRGGRWQRGSRGRKRADAFST